MEKLLTISIAAYNVEKYIAECVESLLLPEIIDKLEIFIVDDGGNDETFAIAQKYQQMYPQSVNVIHKENGGFGTVQNYSIAHATGKFFKLLDGDDWFDKDGLLRLMNVLEHAEQDVIITNVFTGHDRNNLVAKKNHHEEDGTVIELKNYKNPHHYIFPHWCLTYKTNILKNSNLVLPSHSLYTDMLYFSLPFSMCNELLFCDFSVYCYRIGRDGQSVSKESRIKHYKEMLDMTENTIRKCSDYVGESSIILDRVTACYITALRTILLCGIDNQTRKELIEYETKIKSISPLVYYNIKNISKTGKCLFLIRKSHYLLFWALKLIPGGMPNWY